MTRSLSSRQCPEQNILCNAQRQTVQIVQSAFLLTVNATLLLQKEVQRRTKKEDYCGTLLTLHTHHETPSVSYNAALSDIVSCGSIIAIYPLNVKPIIYDMIFLHIST